MNLSQLGGPTNPIHILLVDDDEGDVILTRKAFEKGKTANSIITAADGVIAMQILRREGKHSDAVRPDLILLDLNMPRKDGRETLAEIKSDPTLRSIPVIVMTTSEADRDIMQSYDLQASCYIAKPVDLAQFSKVIESLQEFWFCVVRFPNSHSSDGNSISVQDS